MSYLAGVLGSERRSSRKATSTLAHWTISPAPLNTWLLSTVFQRWINKERWPVFECDSFCQGKKKNISPLHEISRYWDWVLCTWFYPFHAMGTAGICHVAFECIHIAYQHTSHFPLARIAMHKLLGFSFQEKPKIRVLLGNILCTGMMLQVDHLCAPNTISNKHAYAIRWHIYRKCFSTRNFLTMKLRTL